MKKTNCLFTLWVAALCAGTHAYAVGTAPTILSNYGEIQSVKNYSSNPFWNKNSPYNQNFPKPIYATGADLNTGDCNRVVENLVTAYCAEHNYCRNLRISDVRPTIMVQLSQLPGHNFATSCGGYIDSAFDKFQKEYGNTSTVNLPNATTQNTTVEIANPFAPKQTAAQKAVADRTAELERLQSITTPAAGVHAEYFPKTTADLSFTDRIANTAAGYEPYKDKESYKKPDFLGEDEEFFNRLRAQNFEEFCKRRPDNDECRKLREHNISYITFDSKTKCTPTKYETGKGATVSCVPQRDNSTFLGWCLDYDTATTYNNNTSCPPQHTIAKTDTDDKIYYAKWKCNKPEYEQTQTACIDPNAGGGGHGDGDGDKCPGKIAGHYDQTTCECYPSDFMDSADCKCRGKISTWDATNHKCVCPISTANLAIEEWAYVTTMCQCPSTKPNYNPTTHLCEKDNTPPSNDETYALLQCRSETIPNYDLLGDGAGNMSDPFRELMCETDTDRSLRKCFTRCMSNYDNERSPGLINKTLDTIVPTKFCAGYFSSGGMFATPVGFLSYSDHPRMISSAASLKIMTFKSTDITSIKNALNNLAQTDRRNYCYTGNHKYWLIYIMKKNNDNTWKVAEKPLILYHDD